MHKKRNIAVQVSERLPAEMGRRLAAALGEFEGSSRDRWIVVPTWRYGRPAREIKMTCRTVCLILFCWLAVTNRSRGADRPEDADGITVLHDLRYREGPSRQWRLDLAMKQETRGKPRPGIVVIHGGGWREGDKSSFASREAGVPGNIVDFAAQGFVALTINYRLSNEAPFPAALEDCKCAVRWLRAHAKEFHLDPHHIGAYGNSAGGHLAMLLGTVGKEEGFEGDGPCQEESSSVQAVVSDSGPVDLLDQYEHDRLREVIARFLGGPPERERLVAYKRASPSHHVGPNVPPLLLIYGGADEQVPVETADRFVVALDRAGHKDVSYHRLALAGHCPHSLGRVRFLQPVVNEFFARTLLPREATRPASR